MSMQLSPRKTIWVMILFGIGWSAITLSFDVFNAVGIHRQLLTWHYQQTTGVVLTSKVTETESHDEHGSTITYGVDIRYRYHVGGKTLESGRYRFAAGSSSDNWARTVVNEHPVGSKITVYYDPAQPQEAVLMQGVQPSDLFMTQFLFPFNMVMLGCWAFGIRTLWRRLRPPAHPGRRIIERGSQTRLRGGYVGCIGAGLATAGLAAFIGIFVIAFGAGGFHPTWEAIRISWTCIAIAGLAGIFLRAVYVATGRGDWVLDDAAGQFRMTLQPGTNGRQTMPLANLAAVMVYSEEDPALGKCKLVFEYADGTKRMLFTPLNQAQSQELALWLGARTGILKAKSGR
jgi:hypothetical protein